MPLPPSRRLAPVLSPNLPSSASRSRFRSGFRRSDRTGNLWRRYGDLTVSVFLRPSDGTFGWSIADSEGPRFSPHGYETEDDSLDALQTALEDDDAL